MNINYENKLFHGEIDNSVTTESMLPIKDIYTDPGIMSGKINEFRQRVLQLEENIYRRADLLEKEIIKWNSDFVKIQSGVEELESKVNDDLFLRSDSDGYYKTINENFTKDQGISYTNSSNIFVDLPSNLVRLQTGSSQKLALKKEKYSVTVVKPNSGVNERVIPVAGSDLNSLDQDNCVGWTGSVTSPSRAPISLMFEITMNTTEYVSNVVFSMINGAGNASISAIVTDLDNKARVILENADVSNSNVIPVNGSAKKIQIIVFKNSYDERLASGQYRYLFHIKRLIVEGDSSYLTEGIFSSSDYFITNASKLAIEVCDFLNESTNIEYYLNIQNMFDSTVVQTPINPLNKPPGSSPYAIKLSDIQSISNVNSNIKIDSTVSSTAIIKIPNTLKLFNFTNEYKILNYTASLNKSNLGSVNFFANYIAESNNPLDLIERVGNFYYSWIYIDKEVNKYIAVGDSGISIQGLTTAKGIINFDKTGWFRIKIPISSYYDSGKSFASVEELQALDPLYPYNGKYILEGTNLQVEPYLGFKKRAKKKLNLVTNLDQLDSNSFYLLRDQPVADNYDIKNKFYIILSKDTDIKNGYFEYQSQNELMYYLRLVAKFKTTDKTKTPILSSYKIKLGD
ncbi:MAG: hypothetical protein EB127_02175 [Alphaproteobacteria bacterium]|nr:hypothetical protein [Alphaproteobacteria bacterium]